MTTAVQLDDIRDALGLCTYAERAEIDRLLAGADSFYEFVRLAWPVVEPATPFVDGWHIGLICEHLQAVADREIKQLIINVPPRHTKSLLVSVLFPTWVWSWRPSERFLCASYAQRLATRDAVRSRRILVSPWYQSRFGGQFQLTGDQNEKTRYENDKGGYRIATSVGGTATGDGGDVLILDDPHKADEATSDTVREGVLDWVKETWSTRKNDPRTAAEIIIMQRLHERDVTGYLLSEIGGYENVMLPARYEADRTTVTVLGPTDQRTEPGALLWPERYGDAELSKLETLLGSYGTAGQLQQRPTPAGGGLLKKDWFVDYDELPEKFDEIVLSWDMTFKDTESGSFVVGQVWGRRGADKFLIDQVRGRWDFPATVVQFRGQAKQYPTAGAKLVEDKANGPAIISTLKHEIRGIIAVTVKGSKTARAHAVAPDIEAGNVYIPRRAAWRREFIAEVEAFPNGPNDDQVDAMTQALDRLYRPQRITEQKIRGI
jgi:predicted phage terminase large subunit-like protein